MDALECPMFDDSYDKSKSDWTKEKRGIDFIEAREIWSDPEAIEGPADMKNGEERWLKAGQVKGKIWTVDFTLRNGKIRIFMVRPARKEEKEVYNGY